MGLAHPVAEAVTEESEEMRTVMAEAAAVEDTLEPAA